MTQQVIIKGFLRILLACGLIFTEGSKPQSPSLLAELQSILSSIYSISSRVIPNT